MHIGCAGICNKLLKELIGDAELSLFKEVVLVERKEFSDQSSGGFTKLHKKWEVAQYQGCREMSFLLSLCTMKKKILWAVVAVLVIAQFIRPDRNDGVADGAGDIASAYTVPVEVNNVLRTACYDCHSNHTNYPWYANIQPIGWWMQGHINDAKRHLNFSEFGTYPEKRAKHKFEEIEDAVVNGWMPLGSYTAMHGEAKLTPDQSKAVGDWAAALK